MTKIKRFIRISALILLALCAVSRAGEAPVVTTMRVPGGGVQPQAAVDDAGVVHLVYLSGDPSHSDIFYVQSKDAATFSKPLRVNSQPGSAVAMGTIRGAHLALGRAGKVYVAWTGSMSAEPKAPGKLMPVLFARSIDGGASFEPQRNVIQTETGPAEGASVAADDAGSVYVAWHAPMAKGEGEQSRRVLLARSRDDGKTFAAETPVSGQAGTCGCCGLRIAVADGSLLALYRTADQHINRNMTLLRVDPATLNPVPQTVGIMQSAVCVMSTSALSKTPAGELGAWEINGQIFWSSITAQPDRLSAMPVPGPAGGRKHPALAANGAGQILVVWTQGTGWNKGGTIAWQIYEPSGTPSPNGAGRADKLPVWGAPAAFAKRDGSFVIVY
ncbi:MAG TPA: sialidase family protein [Tepidisphaeraceae bacterium]|nr:sialidase family protein [Tepidisphaeraceae bacterium]